MQKSTMTNLLLIMSNTQLYTHEFKYIVFVIIVSDDFYAVGTMGPFDNVEHTNNIPRTIAWYPLNMTIDNIDKLALRLSKNAELINYLCGQVLF